MRGNYIASSINGISINMTITERFTKTKEMNGTIDFIISWWFMKNEMAIRV